MFDDCVDTCGSCRGSFDGFDNCVDTCGSCRGDVEDEVAAFGGCGEVVEVEGCWKVVEGCGSVVKGVGEGADGEVVEEAVFRGCNR